jgi:hypothetical protein
MEQSIKETIKANINNLRKDCEMALTGEWDCTTQEGIDTGFTAMIEVVDEIECLIDGEKTQEMRVFVVDVDQADDDFEPKCDDETFITQAEMNGTVYSLKGFQEAFNDIEVSKENAIIRFILCH